jgi:DNA-binding response OmpR family regulator
MRILLIEDDESVAEALEKVLVREHYAVDTAYDGEMGWQLVESFSYDLILLDLILPKLDGLQFCQQLRDRGYQVPVLLVTAENSTTKRVMGLDAGADDYMAKPFELEELLARIRVLLRRGAGSPTLSALTWEHLYLNPVSHEAIYHDRPLQLTPKEYRLLELFLRRPHHVFSRSAILEHLWTSDEPPNEDTVTAHMKGLRQKLKRVGAPTHVIETVYGVGYRLRSPENSGSEPVPSASFHDSLTSQIALTVNTLPCETQNIKKNSKNHSRLDLLSRQPSELSCNSRLPTQAALAEVWQRHQESQSDRLSILKQAAAIWLDAPLSDGLRHNAQRAAHKLAGALGVFGLSEGSRIASDIEQLFSPNLTLSSQDKVWLAELVNTLDQLLQQQSTYLEPRNGRFQNGLPLVVLIDNNLALIEEITRVAKAQGIHMKTALDLTALQVIRAEMQTNSIQQPLQGVTGYSVARTGWATDMVLLNLSLRDCDHHHLKALADLTQQLPPLPIIICTNDDSLENRVKSVHLGSSAFLYQPTTDQILEVVTRVRSHWQTSPANVLIVDDDPQVLEALQALLLPWGIGLTTLDQPDQFWQALERCSPDLVVLDVNMPVFNGLELCRLVRHTPLWSHMPILFLTAHADASIERQAFAAGATTVLDKAMPESELVGCILNQLERSHLRQTMMAMDTR